MTLLGRLSAASDVELSPALASALVPSDFVYLTSRFTSSWPWPESSWGLDPMYGEDGWCRSCGVPQRPQTGSLVLQASKLPRSNFWMPNWQYDALCVREPAAEHVLREFRVSTRPVRTPRATDTGILQLVPTIAAASVFDAAALASQAKALHGVDGRRCEVCRTWRWMPLGDEHLPDAVVGPEAEPTDLVASPDWFGDGFKAFRVLLFRRSLAEALVRLNPRVWSVVESRRDRRQVPLPVVEP